MVWFWDRVSVRDKSLFVVMTVLSLSASRFIIFRCAALVPLWVEGVEFDTGLIWAAKVL